MLAKEYRRALKPCYFFLARNSKQARILIVESSGLSPQLQKRRRSIFSQYQATLRHTLESAPERFGLDNIAMERCISGAAFEGLHCWLEENHKTRHPATEIARAVAQFNAQAANETASSKWFAFRGLTSFGHP